MKKQILKDVVTLVRIKTAVITDVVKQMYVITVFLPIVQMCK